MRRRRLLAAIGSGAIALQAGCIAGGGGDPTPTDDGTDEPTDEPTEEPTDEPTETDVQPEIVDRSIETTRAECVTDGDEVGVDVEFGADGVTIDGLARVSNPCHEATIESAAVDTGELSVGIGFESTDEMCTECVGAIEYSATVDLDGADGLDAVTVDHADGESHTVSRGE